MNWTIPTADGIAIATAMQREFAGTATTTTGARRILVAEDNLGMLRLLARALRQQGYDVVTATSGSELMQWVELLERWDDRVPLIDLIVTDLRMPQYSGQDCLAHLRRAGNGIPVVLITAFGSEQVHREAFAAGARAVLDKPLQLDDLCEVVRRNLPA